jgi:hypothetical protein
MPACLTPSLTDRMPRAVDCFGNAMAPEACVRRGDGFAAGGE